MLFTSGNASWIHAWKRVCFKAMVMAQVYGQYATNFIRSNVYYGFHIL